MAQRVAAQVTAYVGALAISATIAQAQTLQHLTVQSFDLRADTRTPRVDVPFHLVVTLRTRQRLSQIENLDLPILAQLELLGDVRSTIATPKGTQYRETITLLAHDAGTISIGSATLQAIDARDGKPKQWFTNGLALRVSGTGSAAIASPANAAIAAIGSVLRFFLWLLVWIVGIGCAAAIALLLIRRRRRSLPAPILDISPISPRSPRLQAQDALTVLSTERTRATAVRVRAAMLRMAGASNGETLRDVLRRTDPADVSLRELLVALERSAFTYDADLCGAIADACTALERFIASTVS